MTTPYIDLLFIALFMAGFNYSGFINTTEDWINDARHKRGKLGTFSWKYPIGCEVCRMFWVGIIYLIVVLFACPNGWAETYNIFALLAYNILLSVAQGPITALLRLVLESLEALFVKLTKKL